MVGTPQELLNNLDKTEYPEDHKNILRLFGEKPENNLDFIGNAFLMLRNVVTIGLPSLFNQKPEIQANFIQMLFYLVGQIYGRYASEKCSFSERALSASTNLFIYLV